MESFRAVRVTPWRAVAVHDLAKHEQQILRRWAPQDDFARSRSNGPPSSNGDSAHDRVRHLGMREIRVAADDRVRVEVVDPSERECVR